MPLPFKVQSSEFEVRSSLLNAFLSEVWGRRYQLGQWDCILFIAAWADRLHFPGRADRPGPPISFTDRFRGKYSTEEGGLRRFARHGINPAITAALLQHGWNRVPDYTFLPGDIILTDLFHPGIWDGSKIVAQPARATGLLHLLPSHAVLALRYPSEPAL
jgi:hypothetical protein